MSSHARSIARSAAAARASRATLITTFPSSPKLVPAAAELHHSYAYDPADGSHIDGTSMVDDRHAFTKDGDHARPAVVRDLHDALTAVYGDADVHLSYYIPAVDIIGEGSKTFRLSNLSRRHTDILITAIGVDIDNPDHAPWPFAMGSAESEESLARDRALIGADPILGKAALWYSNGGRKLAIPLARPLRFGAADSTKLYVESFIRGLRDHVAAITAGHWPEPDPAAGDWTRMWRAPYTLRGGVLQTWCGYFDTLAPVEPSAIPQVYKPGESPAEQAAAAAAAEQAAAARAARQRERATIARESPGMARLVAIGDAAEADANVSRARAYALRNGGSPAGSRHADMLRMSVNVVCGFGLESRLSEAEAIMFEWAATCSPPYTAPDELDDIREAVRTAPGKRPSGYILARREAYQNDRDEEAERLASTFAGLISRGATPVSPDEALASLPADHDELAPAPPASPPAPHMRGVRAADPLTILAHRGRTYRPQACPRDQHMIADALIRAGLTKRGRWLHICYDPKRLGVVLNGADGTRRRRGISCRYIYSPHYTALRGYQFIKAAEAAAESGELDPYATYYLIQLDLGDSPDLASARRRATALRDSLSAAQRRHAPGVERLAGIRVDEATTESTLVYMAISEPATTDELAALAASIDRISRRHGACCTHGRGFAPCEFYELALAVSDHQSRSPWWAVEADQVADAWDAWRGCATLTLTDHLRETLKRNRPVGTTAAYFANLDEIEALAASRRAADLKRAQLALQFAMQKSDEHLRSPARLAVEFRRGGTPIDPTAGYLAAKAMLEHLRSVEPIPDDHGAALRSALRMRRTREEAAAATAAGGYSLTPLE